MSSKNIHYLAGTKSVTLQTEMEHLQVLLLCCTKQLLSWSMPFSLVKQKTFPDTGATVNCADNGTAERIHNKFLARIWAVKTA